MNELHWIGLLVGMRHALDADHVAAVASLVSVDKGLTKKQALNHGMFWGIGHSITLILVASVVIIMGQSLPATWSLWLETAVGVMLVFLGISIFYRFRSLPSNKHSSKQVSDGGVVKGRALAVGSMHGLAGSSVLMIILMESMPDLMSRILYLILFSVGSIIGMVIVSGLISLPLVKAQMNVHLRQWLYSLIAVVTLFIGVEIIISNMF